MRRNTGVCPPAKNDALSRSKGVLLPCAEAANWLHSAIPNEGHKRRRPDLRCSTARRVARYSLLFVQIFARHVVFGYFAGANFLPFSFRGVFDARYDPGFERVAFFQQFVNTFRIDVFAVG